MKTKAMLSNCKNYFNKLVCIFYTWNNLHNARVYLCLQSLNVNLRLGKGNPRYEYKYKDGNFVATLHVPGTDLVVNGEPASTKQQVSV